MIIIYLIKTALYFALSEYSIKDLEWMPFISTRFQNESNVDEALFFIQRQSNPYLTDQIFQKPLLIYFLAYLKQNQICYKVYFLIVDLLISWLIKQFASTQQVGYKKSLEIFYHFNPITFLQLLAKNTDGIDILTFMASLFILQKFRFSYHALLTSAFLFALSLYLNPNNLILFAVILIMLKNHSQLRKRKYIEYIAVYTFCTTFFFCYLIYVSFVLTGDWLFIEKSYISTYYPDNHYPTLGFIWALFSGLFTRYKTLYHSLFAFFPICFLVPFYIIFQKYGITVTNKPITFMGLMIGTCYFTSLLYFHYVTSYYLFIAFALFFQGSFYVYRIQIVFVLIYTPAFISIMASGLYMVWIHSLTGNPNFLFFECFVFYLFSVVLVTETIKEFIKYSREQQAKLKIE